MAALADQNGRRASRLEERRLLADLTDFPNLAAVLAFEETWKKNIKKKKKNKKRKMECQAQIVTEEQHQEPGEMAITEGIKLQELVVISDGSDEVLRKGQSCEMDGKDTVQSMEVVKRQGKSLEEEDRGNNVGVGIADDHSVSNGQKSKMDEYRMLADLSDFPNLAAMLDFEENWKKNRKRNKKKKKKKQRKSECETQHDMEECHSGEKPITEGQKFQDLSILPENINGEVMQKIQSCKRGCKGTMESIEVKKKQESCKKEDRGNNVGVGTTDHKVSNRHISKADEHRMLADLTDYPHLATMLAFEATWRQNRKKKNNKRRKLETRVENDMGQHHQKPVRVAATEEPNCQDLVILLDSSDNEGMKSDRSCKINGEDVTKLSKGKKQNISKDKEEKGDNIGVKSTNHEVSSGQMSKSDEYKQATMLTVEATVRKNRREDKERRKFEFQVLHNLTDAAKEETQKTTGKAKAFNADDNVRSAVIIDLCSSEEEGEKLIVDQGSSKVFREMLPAETTGKRKENRIKAPEYTVNILGENKKPDSGKELIPFQVKPVERMDEIVPRKLLVRPRYFHQPESSRRMSKDDHSAIKDTMQKWKKPCSFYGSSNHNALHCKQVIGCSVCCGRGHLAIDCPQKHVVKDEHSKLCLKCGNSGHDLSSCNDDYSCDDLKKIQCFHCKAFGHLGCFDFMVDDQRLQKPNLAGLQEAHKRAGNQ